jgi:hypothetical protein
MATYGSIRYSGIEDAGIAGSGTTAYANTTDLPTSEVTTGAMAYVSGTNKLYMWNGTAWFNIAIVNQAPTAITGNQASYALAINGTPTVVTLVSTDPEGLPLTWSSSTSGDTQVGTFSLTDNVFTITPSTNEANIGTLSVTFSVTDGNNTETSVSSFTLGFLSPYWNETVLSIGTSSTNGLANNTFIDRSTNAHTVTPAGTPVQTAFHPYLDNWSVEFDGSGDYIRKSGSGVLTSSEDVTIECWAYPLSSSVIGLFDGGSGQQSILRNYPSNVVGNSHGNRISFTMVPNAWNHFALTVTTGASGGNATCYINGTSVGTAAFGAYVGGNNFDIGIINAGYGAGDGNFNGYVSNFRVTKSIVYNQNFTPPTEKLTAITGTTLLTCQSNRFVDNSSNAYTITPAGNVEISAFNPFGQESEYAVGENKGSGYFDGSGDYLRVPYDAGFALGSSNFTIEYWVYPTVLTGDITVLATHTSDPTGGYGVGFNGTLARTWLNFSGDWLQVTGPAASLNTWNHIAVVRDGSSFYMYTNGVRGTVFTSGGAVTNSANSDVTVGARYNGAGNYYTGYVSNVRIVKGTALYTTNFTPPTAPVGNANASLYLPMDNAGIFDKTGNNTLTPVGNASTSTTQTKYADTAMYFDGSGDSIYIDDQPLFNFGTQDFTIEMWIKPNVSSNFGGLFTIDAGPYPSVLIYNSETNNIRIYLDNNNSSPFALTQDVTIPSTNWQHFAFTRDGNIFRSFLDGILINTTTSSITIAPQRAPARIGTGDSGSPWNGYIENFQILKGVAKYTANFTPPNRTQGITYQAES